VADFERPPRRPIRDRYLVTSEGTSQRTKSRFYRQALASRRNFRLKFTASSPSPHRWRTSHYVTCADFEHLSPFRSRNKPLRSFDGGRNVAFHRIVRPPLRSAGTTRSPNARSIDGRVLSTSVIPDRSWSSLALAYRKSRSVPPSLIAILGCARRFVLVAEFCGSSASASASSSFGGLPSHATAK